MPLPSEVVGRIGLPVTHAVDARWTMAYAAGLGHDEPDYFDTGRRPDVIAHPLFPVCFEWPVFLDPRHLPAAGMLAREERLRGVHATHDLVLHRPLRAGAVVTTRAQVVQVEARRPGAYQVTRLDSEDETGTPLCTTWYGTLFRGVAVEGPDRRLDEACAPELAGGDVLRDPDEHPLPIPRNAAHVYTECARIWNPIHTDRAVALKAGLPDIILHGTATLAHAVSRVMRERLSGDPSRVTRIAARFAAMVRMPSTCRVRVGGPVASRIGFEVRNGDGESAIRDGLVVARD